MRLSTRTSRSTAGKVGDPEVLVQTIPETNVAAVVHTGPFSEFQLCHVDLANWLAENNCDLAGPYREIYHACLPDEATTEVQYPIIARQPARSASA